MGSVASIERYRFGPFELVITGRATSASAIWPWRSIGAACGGAARELYEQALVAAREHGRSWETGSVLNLVGRAERDEGLHDLALKHLVEGITILHALGNRPGVIES